MTFRRALPLLLILGVTVSCASGGGGNCEARDRLHYSDVTRRTTLSEIAPRFAAAIGLETLPESQRPGAMEGINAAISRAQAMQRPGDEVWFFREEKGRGTRWYREGYLLIRGCEVVDEIETLDQM